MKFGIHPFLYFIKYMYLQSYTVTTFSLILSPMKTNKNWCLKLYSLLLNQRTLGKVIVNSLGEFLSVGRPLNTLYLMSLQSFCNHIQCQITQIFLPATQIEMQLPQIFKFRKNYQLLNLPNLLIPFQEILPMHNLYKYFFFKEKTPTFLKTKFK